MIDADTLRKRIAEQQQELNSLLAQLVEPLQRAAVMQGQLGILREWLGDLEKAKPGEAEQTENLGV